MSEPGTQRQLRLWDPIAPESGVWMGDSEPRNEGQPLLEGESSIKLRCVV